MLRTRGRPRHPETLTPRQQDVQRLLRRGLTNEEIARELGISLDGVKYHVSDILRRLHVESRHEAALWRPEPAERRPWALGALPLGWLPKLKWSTAAYVASGAVVVLAVAGIGLLLWGVLRSSDDDAPTIQARIQGNELIAYTTLAREINTAEESAQVWHVGVYDPAEGRHLSEFEVGDIGESPVQVVPAGDEFLFNLSSRIVAYKHDGSGRRVVREAQPDGSIVAIASSPDGRQLAVSEFVEEHCPAVGESCRPWADVIRLAVIDVASGDEVFSMRQNDPRLAAIGGAAGRLAWRADGRGFMFEGLTQSEALGGVATVMLVGDVHVEPDDGYWLAVSPRGNATLDTPEVICGDGLDLSWERHELTVNETVTGRRIARLADDGVSIAPVAWAPTGDELMYRTYSTRPNEARPGCTLPDPGSFRWYVLDLATGTSTEWPDRFAIEEGWSGDATVEFRCGSERGEEAYCPGNGAAAPVDAYAGGVKFVTGTHFRLIATPPRDAVNQ